MLTTFRVDTMLGRLARWLRALGWDTEYEEIGEISSIKQKAKTEGRFFLTRRRNIDEQYSVFIESEELEKQLFQLEKIFQVLTKANPFSRCINCNCVLIEIDKAKIKNKVPFFTYTSHANFSICPDCGKVFWKGSHHDAIVKEIRKLLFRMDTSVRQI